MKSSGNDENVLYLFNEKEKGAGMWIRYHFYHFSIWFHIIVFLDSHTLVLWMLSAYMFPLYISKFFFHSPSVSPFANFLSNFYLITASNYLLPLWKPETRKITTPSELNNKLHRSFFYMEHSRTRLPHFYSLLMY